ncbi:adenosylcobinamide-phosphate synthase CbiB [Holophaga foetida]|uniref:adenosylcobinamide-phosphate synthase CbiB n=1 Tax=Holophaga foetida TaxID=35839 RepID=UPI0002471826|nr:adenosylcobinamide-phosphate synthase CbiB [Holophaga foetida]
MHPLVFLGAGLLDEAIGDPPSWPHPVRVIGIIIEGLDKARRRVNSPNLLRFLGVFLALGMAALAGGFAWGVLRLCGPWAWIAELILGAWMLAGRSLRDAVRPVALALETGDLDLARREVAMVVGRDTATLDGSEIARAGLETVAESLCDGVLAPLFWFAIGGVPALWAFKAVSTLDSMVGHMEAPYTHFGWASARLDDLLNLIPARLSVLLIALAAWSGRAIRLAWRDGSKTSSPNAGWCEAAYAGALGIQLGGRNVYDGVPHEGPRLGDPGRTLDGPLLREGLGLERRVNLLALLLGAALLSLRYLHG